jgi:UDP-GlcNAc:undecaprenyl-phosphate GlcNAc-1-phosphate transferase
LGLYDDFRNVKPHKKLIGQIMVASIVVFFGFRLNWFSSRMLDIMGTLFWIVGMTNAFNLIDNMDGLCAGIGCIASITLALLYYSTAPDAAVIASILAGASAGFLIYNFSPAKIFMGDCGSLVLGFTLSVLALYYSERAAGPALTSIAVPILILIVPILDTTVVTLMRTLSGRKAFTGGRDHTSHRLVLIGFSEKKAVLFLYGTGTVSGLAAILVSRSNVMTSLAVIIPVAVVIILIGIFLSKLKIYPDK